MCGTFLANITDELQDGQTSYKKRFGKNFYGPRIPFGAAVWYKPSSQKDKDRVHKVGNKLLLGIFGGYSQQYGGGWNNDVFVHDQEEIAKAENSSEVETKRFNYKTSKTS